MTTGTKGRGTTQYWVRNPETNITTNIAVRYGRLSETLNALMLRGATGCSFFEYPAPRWASYVHRLKALGIDIRTELETHGGAHPGRHARYFLLSDVTRKVEKGPA